MPSVWQHPPMFQYPESLLEEYFTTSLLESDMLNRWIDSDNYYDETNGTLLPISNLLPKLKIEIYQFVQEAIDAAVTQCQGNPMLGESTFKDVPID